MITVLVIEWHEDADPKAVRYKMEDWINQMMPRAQMFGVKQITAMKEDTEWEPHQSKK